MSWLSRSVRPIEWDDNRIGRFDFVKGVYILLVVLMHGCYSFIISMEGIQSHSKLLTGLKIVLQAGQVGANVMLMMVCGYDYRKKSIRNSAKIQIKYLWKPCLITTLTVFVTTAAVAWISNANVLKEVSQRALPFVFGNVEGKDYFGIAMNDIGPMWFIYAFIICGIILSAVLQLNDETLQWLTVLILYGISTTGGIGRINLEGLPFGMYRALLFTLYMFLGWQMKKHRFLEKSFPIWMLISAAVFTIVAAVHQRSDGLASAFFAYGILVLLLRLDKIRNRFTDWIRCLGQQIMPFCCIHSVVYTVIPAEMIQARYTQKPVIGCLVATGIYLITGIGGCILFNYIRNRRRHIA